MNCSWMWNEPPRLFPTISYQSLLCLSKVKGRRFSLEFNNGFSQKIEPPLPQHSQLQFFFPCLIVQYLHPTNMLNYWHTPVSMELLKDLSPKDMESQASVGSPVVTMKWFPGFPPLAAYSTDLIWMAIFTQQRLAVSRPHTQKSPSLLLEVFFLQMYCSLHLICYSFLYST